jgi:hypothetical protein
MKQLFTYILIFFSTLLLFNCKKYPEGGYHFNAIKHLKGEWKLKLYEVNGLDSTEIINYNGNDNYKKISFNTRQGTYSKDLDCRINGKNAMNIHIDSKREFISFDGGGANSAIACDPIINNNCYKLIFLPEAEQCRMDWKILKLTKNEVIITSTQKNSYRIKLSK